MTTNLINNQLNESPEMVKVLTHTLIDEALDWVIANCEGVDVHRIMTAERQSPLEGLISMGCSQEQIATLHSHPTYLIGGDQSRPIRLSYSTNWSKGCPILDREGISTVNAKNIGYDEKWMAAFPVQFGRSGDYVFGPTMLIAGLRAYAVEKCGAEVEVPKLILDSIHRATSPYADERMAMLLLHSKFDEFADVAPSSKLTSN
jgi:Protein of unknown function (DUF2591)